MSIRQKMASMLALLIIVPLIIMGATSYIKATTLLKESYIESSTALNQAISDEIDEEFVAYLYGLQMLAGSPEARTLIDDPKSEAELMKVMELFIETYPDAFQVYFGTELSRTRIIPKCDVPNSYDSRQRDWYQLAKNKGEVNWTSMYQDTVTGNWALSATIPIYDNDEKFIGALATDLNLMNVSEDIADSKIGQSGQVLIVDKAGIIIAHPNLEYVGKRIPVDSICQELEKGEKSGHIDYIWTLDDGKEIEKFAVYEFIPQTGWYVMTTLNHDEISDATDDLLKGATIIGVITLVIAGIIALFFSNSITKPIQNLVESMKKAELGDVTVQSDINRKDELGNLATSFNQMLKNISAIISATSEAAHEVSEASKNLGENAEGISISSQEVTATVEEIAKGASDQANDAQNAVILANELDKKFAQLGQRSTEISNSANTVGTINAKGLVVLSSLKIKGYW